MSLRPFHLALPTASLAQARAFYSGLLGCREGRSSERWVDFDFFGHQLVFHQAAGFEPSQLENPVDGEAVPVPHFGLVLTPEAWRALADRLQRAGVAFVIAPSTRFKGEVGEQATMFFRDPNGWNLEIKAFADDGQLFAT